MGFDRRHYTMASGRDIGSKSTKILGCEVCNFAKAYKSKAKCEKDGEEFLNTGAECPRCETNSLRVFDSRAEHTRSCELKLLQSSGHISDLLYQIPFTLHAPSFDTGEPIALCKFVPDFTYTEYVKDSDGNDVEDFIVEDVKNKSGVMTETAAMKIKHFEIEYGIDVRITGR